LSGDALQLLHRRILVLTLIAWVPLLLSSIAEGSAWGTSIVKVPFLYDIEMHLRLLVALPLLMVAEVVVHRRLRPAVQQFVERDLIPNSAQAQFEAAIAAALPAQLGHGRGALDCDRLRGGGVLHLADSGSP
jgi:hypothetical protein